jgi:hypothetical protein
MKEGFKPKSFKNYNLTPAEQMINNRKEALAAHELAKTRIANRKQLNFTPFEKNQKVWLDMRNLKMNHNKKIAPK